MKAKALRLICMTTILLMGMGNSLPQAPSVNAQATSCHFFSETGKSACGRFLQYWQTHGGLAQQGYPISESGSEVSEVDGRTYTVQYFERAVFEHHPEFAPPNDVLLTLLGSLRYAELYGASPPAQRANASTGSRRFSETGRYAGGAFLQYWTAHGGLAQQGFPISDEFTEISALNGQPYVVQYFERAVFEYHPELAPPNNVLLSQLGTFSYDRKYRNAGRTLPGAAPPPAVGGQPPPVAPPPAPNPVASRNVQQFADYIAQKYRQLGSLTMTFEDVDGNDLEGIHFVHLDVTLGTSSALDSQTAAAGKAWGDAIMAEASANWPSEPFIIDLQWVTWSSDPCFRNCSSDCYYQSENYSSGLGWYTTFTFVRIEYKRGVIVCHYFDG